MLNFTVKPIDNQMAIHYIVREHYLHNFKGDILISFGIYQEEKLSGVLIYGECWNVGRFKKIVKGKFVELLRMHLSDDLPKNSESRAISLTIKCIRKQFPELRHIFTYGDGVKNGIGICYKGANFAFVEKTHYPFSRIDPATGLEMTKEEAIRLNILEHWQNWDYLPGYQYLYIYDIKRSDRSKKEKLRNKY
ncbi:MAG TPA: hypothetical protein PLE33_06015 [Candidatus Cloacimonas sp.]|nr:hypothetical protein [Candidatus Cloacimonas sp.]HPS60801.1 hypothetical protein [Candidatus Cloacimonas sp.]